ncbi:MAG: hypothetical protein H0W14_13300 [Actinobacteria bacterium]|nr:hypothetical protein [Actinomycetota bacterium]
MTTQLLLAYGVFWATLMKPLLVRAQLIPASCARCGNVFERRELGGRVCNCPSP